MTVRQRVTRRSDRLYHMTTNGSRLFLRIPFCKRELTVSAETSTQPALPTTTVRVAEPVRPCPPPPRVGWAIHPSPPRVARASVLLPCGPQRLLLPSFSYSVYYPPRGPHPACVHFCSRWGPFPAVSGAERRWAYRCIKFRPGFLVLKQTE